VTRLLTLDEAAAALRISVRTVHRLVASGQLRPTKIGRRTLFRESEVEAYLAAAYRRAA
jgi:excisionase family DNA binding protein